MHDLIGDPTALGWAITLLFAYASVQSWLAARAHTHGIALVFWWGLAWGVGFLSLNKQLDFQLFVVDVGRWIVRRLGWYQQRHWVAAAFVLVLTLALGLALFFFARVTRPRPATVAVALSGAVILAAHTVLRASSFELFDVRDLIGGWNPYPLLELLGGSLVAMGARAERLAARQDPPGVEHRRRPSDRPPRRLPRVRP